MRRVSFLLSIGLLAACSETSPTSGSEAVTATNANDAAASTEDEGDGEAVPAAMSLPADGKPASKTGGSELQQVAASTGETVASLPLQRGFYVADGTSCGQASNATLMLVRKSGINTSRVPCDFQSIEKIDATSYRVTETCSEGGAAWGTEEHISTNVSTYEIPNNTNFTSKSDNGWVNSARYCPQSSLPEPWRNNDIADLIE